MPAAFRNASLKSKTVSDPEPANAAARKAFIAGQSAHSFSVAPQALGRFPPLAWQIRGSAIVQES